MELLNDFKLANLSREYYSGSLKQFNTLQQIGAPDKSFNQSKWDLYKITISTAPKRKFSIVKIKYDHLIQ